MQTDLIYAILILVPAGFGNLAPTLFAKIFPKWNYPMDFKKKINGKRILGDHKTFRGLMAGIIMGTFGFVLLETYLPNLFISSSLNLPWYFGALMGFGALAGDAVKSFFKRQNNILPGKSWIPFDQIDWILGSMFFALPYFNLTLFTLSICVGIGFTAHVIAKASGYYLKINEEII